MLPRIFPVADRHAPLLHIGIVPEYRTLCFHPVRSQATPGSPLYLPDTDAAGTKMYLCSQSASVLLFYIVPEKSASHEAPLPDPDESDTSSKGVRSLRRPVRFFLRFPPASALSGSVPSPHNHPVLFPDSFLPVPAEPALFRTFQAQIL